MVTFQRADKQAARLLQRPPLPQVADLRQTADERFGCAGSSSHFRAAEFEAISGRVSGGRLDFLSRLFENAGPFLACGTVTPWASNQYGQSWRLRSRALVLARPCCWPRRSRRLSSGLVLATEFRIGGGAARRLSKAPDLGRAHCGYRPWQAKPNERATSA